MEALVASMATALYPLIPEPEAPSPSTPGVGDSTLVPFQERTGTGYGLLTPFRRDKKSDFASGGLAALVRSCVGQVLGTRADDGRMTGELPWRPEFGSHLHKLGFLPIDETFAAIVRTKIIAAIGQWEPRARVTKVRVSRVYNHDQNIVALVYIDFDVVQAGSNNVLVANQTLEVPIAA